MKSFIAFLKKEGVHFVRSGHLWIFLGIFVLFGVMNPAIAKLTPWMMEMMAESLEESGFAMTVIEVDALTSWAQFFKNIPMALIAFVVIQSNLFTKEYSAGTLILVLTKGLCRYKVVVAKAFTLIFTWSLCYWMCFGVTYGYNAYFWDNSVAHNLMEVVIFYWIAGVFTVALMVLFSAVFSTGTGVLLGTGGIFMASYLVGMVPKIAKYLPTKLMGTSGLLAGTEEVADFGGALTVTIIITVMAFVLSVPILNKKKL